MPTPTSHARRSGRTSLTWLILACVRPGVLAIGIPRPLVVGTPIRTRQEAMQTGKGYALERIIAGSGKVKRLAHINCGQICGQPGISSTMSLFQKAILVLMKIKADGIPNGNP